MKKLLIITLMIFSTFSCNNNTNLNSEYSELLQIQKRQKNKIQQLKSQKEQFVAQINSSKQEIKVLTGNTSKSYSQISNNVVVENKLKLIQRRLAYANKLNDFENQTFQALQVTNFTLEDIKDKIALGTILGKNELDQILSDIDKIKNTSLPETDNLAIDIKNSELQSFEDIWENIIQDNNFKTTLESENTNLINKKEDREINLNKTESDTNLSVNTELNKKTKITKTNLNSIVSKSTFLDNNKILSIGLNDNKKTEFAFDTHSMSIQKLSHFSSKEAKFIENINGHSRYIVGHRNEFRVYSSTHKLLFKHISNTRLNTFISAWQDNKGNCLILDLDDNCYLYSSKQNRVIKTWKSKERSTRNIDNLERGIGYLLNKKVRLPDVSISSLYRIRVEFSKDLTKLLYYDYPSKSYCIYDIIQGKIIRVISHPTEDTPMRFIGNTYNFCFVENDLFIYDFSSNKKFVVNTDIMGKYLIFDLNIDKEGKYAFISYIPGKINKQQNTQFYIFNLKQLNL